jgi:hypothetical protein
MSELTPPPDEPLPDQTRARIRAELLEAAQAGPRTRRWLVPAAVAAAVVLVAGLAAWAVRAGGDGAPDDSAPPAAASSATPTGRGHRVPSHEPSAPGDTADPGDHWAGYGPCTQELRYPLPGAELAATFDDHTSMWVKGDRFALCDVRGRTTVQRPRPLTPEARADTYAVSSVYTASGEVTRVAGGVVPDGATAFDVSYTFPDGETVPAETVSGGGHTWWRVVHTYASQGNEMKDPAIDVTVSYSGVQEHYTLQWGLDTCAQANHGC